MELKDQKKVKILEPIKPNPLYEQLIAESLSRVLAEEIYLPLLLEASEPKKLKNSDDVLIEALRSGRITFRAGAFSGQLNAQITKALQDLGAKYSGGKYRLRINKLPRGVRAAVDSSIDNIARKRGLMLKKIDAIDPVKVATKISIASIYEKLIKQVDAGIESQTYKERAQGLIIQKDYTAAQRKRIAEQYNENMQIWIKDWTEKEVSSLRRMVDKNVQSGIRYESLAKDIKQRYGVSASKAKFLARQETNLLNSALQLQKFEEIGVKEYIWTTVKGTAKHPVRQSHAALDGQRIRLDNPPVVDPKTGRRAHAGEDYNCRCRKKAILNLKSDD